MEPVTGIDNQYLYVDSSTFSRWKSPELVETLLVVPSAIDTLPTPNVSMIWANISSIAASKASESLAL